MATPGKQVFDSPVDWVARHVRRYMETGGRQGHRKWGVDTLLIITRGRVTARWHRTALIYGRDGDRYVVVGSNGGAAAHPNWYLNLLAHPEVCVQVGSDAFAAHARPAAGAERSRLWRAMAEIWPTYDTYQSRARREIPVVVIERLPGSADEEGSTHEQ